MQEVYEEKKKNTLQSKREDSKISKSQVITIEQSKRKGKKGSSSGSEDSTKESPSSCC